jgi:hypothetical protein
MTKRQNDILKMYGVTYDILQEYISVWNTNVPFSDAVTAFKNQIDEINTQANIQSEDTTGITEDKKNVRVQLKADAFTITSAMTFHATATNNKALYKTVYKPRSFFTLTRSSELGTICQTIHKHASDIGAALLPLGVTATTLNDFQTLINKYTDISDEPQEAQYSKKLATQDMKQAFADANNILKNQIDKAMELFRTANEKFYGTYKKGRIIVNSATRRRALKISFFDSTTGKPLKGVLSNIDGKKIRPSSAKGNNFVQHLDEGHHQLVAGIDDYAEESIVFSSVKGEMKKLVVTLKKK